MGWLNRRRPLFLLLFLLLPMPWRHRRRWTVFGVGVAAFGFFGFFFWLVGLKLHSDLELDTSVDGRAWEDRSGVPTSVESME
jgi:hypothetical protein